MSTEFSLISSSDGTRLDLDGMLPEPGDTANRERGSKFRSYRATVTGSDIRATVNVTDERVERWSAFFADLAENWPGWLGSKEVTAVEGEHAAACTANGLGTVTMRVLLRPSVGGADWRLEATLHLDAGELVQIAGRAARFVG